MDIEELKRDLAEVDSLLQQASRKRVKDVLSVTQHKIRTEIGSLEAKAKQAQATASSPASASSGSSSKPASEKTYVVDLNEYAWDQSDKFLKIFATLDGVQKLTEADVEVKFTPTSMLLTVHNLNNKDYRLTINNLLFPINVEKSYHRIKSDMVAIYMKKETEAQKWSHLTLTEKRLNDIKDAKFKTDNDDLKDDPSAGIMNMMKKMYETGDPEMKRMIAKAWTENQEKQWKEPGVL